VAGSGVGGASILSGGLFSAMVGCCWFVICHFSIVVVMLKTAVLILSVLVARNFGCSRTAGILICSSLCDPDALGHQEVTVSGEDIVGGCAGPELQVTLTFESVHWLYWFLRFWFLTFC
jgi:hypothetical protein